MTFHDPPISPSPVNSSPSTLFSPRPQYQIISFCPYYPPHLGGLEKFAEDLHQLFLDHNHRVTVITANLPRQSNHLIHSGNLSLLRYPAFDIIFGYPIPKFWSREFWQIWRHLNRQPNGVVFSSTRFFLSSLIALFFAKTHHLPLLHIEHGSDYVTSNNLIVSLLARIYDSIFGRLVLRASTCNISPSRSAQKFISRFDQRPSHLIYRGLNLTAIDAIPATNKRPIKSNQTLIIFAGRLINAKGVADLIKACHHLPADSFRLLIVGSGPQKKALQSLRRQLNLTAQIKFLGHLSHKKTIALLKTADICVNPSYNEGLPTVLLEAGLARCAIIATSVGGTSEIVRHKISALLYKPSDISTLTFHLSSLINNASLRQSLGINARQSIIDRFDRHQAYQHYMKLFNQFTSHDSPNR